MQREVAIGIDVGGTDVKYGLVTRAGDVAFSARRPTQTTEGREGLAEALEAAVEDLQERADYEKFRIVAAGMGLPGTVSGRRGTVLTSPPQIPGLGGWQAGATLRRLAKVPAAADNDATVAGLAEARLGAARNVPTMVMVTVGTGLGGALVVAGKLVRGRHGTGGEIGHAVFVPDGLPCPHGGRGCLELYASATALKRIWEERGGASSASVRDIVDKARDGNRRARHALDEVGRNLGLGLASAATVVAPDLIVIGGGLAAAGRLLIDPARAAFDAQCLPYVAKTARFIRARLGNRAGLIGAALLGFEEGI